MSQAKRRRTKKGPPAGKILNRITGDDPKLRAAIHEQKLNVLIAEMIHEARTEAGLSQADLADLVGSTQSVIPRLEDAPHPHA